MDDKEDMELFLERFKDLIHFLILHKKQESLELINNLIQDNMRLYKYMEANENVKRSTN